MSYDIIELTITRLGEQLPERLSPCLESHQTDRRSDKIRSGISRQSVNTSGDACTTAPQSAARKYPLLPGRLCGVSSVRLRVQRERPLMAQSGRGLGGRACLLCLGFQTSICLATSSASSTSIPRLTDRTLDLCVPRRSWTARRFPVF